MTIGMYSGGIASFLACLRHSCDVLLFSDTGIEDEDLYRFLREGADYLRSELVVVRASHSFDEMIIKHKSLPNNRMPFCSHVLKHEPARKWIKANAPNADLVFGLDWTETHRRPRVEARWEGHRVFCPMMDPPLLDKCQMASEVKKLGIEPPRLYAMGFPHNNCGGGCVRGGMAAWMLLYNRMPERYAEWVEREKLIPGYTFLKRKTKEGIVLLPLSELPHVKDWDKYDWGGCGCFVDE